MASKIKQKLAKNLYDALRPAFYKWEYEEIFGHFQLKQNQSKSEVSWVVNLPWEKESNQVDPELLKKSQEELFNSRAINELACLKTNNNLAVKIKLNTKHFIKDVLDSNPISLSFKPVYKKVLVEYSSPNIAKPFHVGHLRSTVIGNYVANLKKKLGKDVVRINYLGDWGTQFGMIQLGVEYLNYSVEEVKKNPIAMLYTAYVKGNEIAEKDEVAHEKARKIFNELESGNEETMKLWDQYRKWSVEELNKAYTRLGIEFDEYAWESDYKRKQADKVLKLLEKKGLLSCDAKGRQIATVGHREMPLIKSDGTTLYLIRDLMAVIDRKAKHKFDELYYVVDNGQSYHFDSLITLCEALNISDNIKIKHVKFGRMHGMSTRKGKVIFLSDILDEAMERAYEKQVCSKTTKVPLDNKEVADIIGVSSVVVNDLKHNRKHDYKLIWEEILQLNGDTGGFLQYCHCRLGNLQSSSGIAAASECDPEALQEPEAVNLVAEIAKYETALLKSDAALESSILVRYLFDLARASNAAFRVLNVKNSDAHVGSQRILLFEKSRQVLQDGLTLLGLKPVRQM